MHTYRHKTLSCTGCKNAYRKITTQHFLFNKVKVNANVKVMQQKEDKQCAAEKICQFNMANTHSCPSAVADKPAQCAAS